MFFVGIKCNCLVLSDPPAILHKNRIERKFQFGRVNKQINKLILIIKNIANNGLNRKSKNLKRVKIILFTGL